MFPGHWAMRLPGVMHARLQGQLAEGRENFVLNLHRWMSQEAGLSPEIYPKLPESIVGWTEKFPACFCRDALLLPRILSKSWADEAWKRV